jgi:hypothetical protein
MGHKAQRFGINISRGWVLLLLAAGALVLVGYWIGPLRPLPAQLELLVVDGNSAVEQMRAQPRRTPAGVVFPVPLAVRNIGAESARPRQLILSVPAQYRLASTRGRLTGEVSAGVPLRRYVVELPAPLLEPAETTQLLPGLDTIYIEPDLPRYYCVTQGLQVPEFTPAPSFDAATLSDVRIFYTFAGTAGPERHTGLLTVQLDPSLLEVSPAPMPPSFTTVLEEPEARAPEMGPLSFGGARAATCGDPEQPMQLYTVLWESMTNGRLYVVFVDGEPRKRLYDLNRDGVIDLETWDASGDGRFEARRDARYAVPEFLLPLPPRDPAMIAPDPESPDSAWLELFYRSTDGPSRFARSDLVAHPPVVVAADTTRADTSAAGVAATPATTPAGDPAADLGPVRPATPQFLALFADTAAGPFRFSPRRAQAPQAAPRQPGATPTTPAAPTPAQPQTATPAPADSPQAEPAEPEEPAPRPAPRRRQPLGTPIRN